MNILKTFVEKIKLLMNNCKFILLAMCCHLLILNNYLFPVSIKEHSMVTTMVNKIKLITYTPNEQINMQTQIVCG